MSTDTKWIIGTGIAVITATVGTGGVLAGLMLTQISGVNARIDDLRDDMREIRATLERFDARLDAIEVALAKLDQRLLTIERIVLPAAEPGE
jgi:hypothetical protein